MTRVTTTVSSTQSKRRNPVSRILRSRLFRKKTSKLGFALIIGIFAFVLLGPFFSPQSPYQISGPRDSPPSISHPFGTDYQGHDIMSQVMWGAYPSLLVGLAAAVGSTVVGFVVGMLAGYYGKLEALLSGGIDIVMSIPTIPLLVLIGSLFLASNQLLIAALILVLWAPFSRGIRAQVASVKKVPYVQAAKTSGLSDSQILWRIISPEVIPIGIAYFILGVSSSIILVTALEFLGVGNPQIVSWGSMLFFAQQYGFYSGDWWWVLAPGLSIALVSTGFALIGFSLEEILNPRLRV